MAIDRCANFFCRTVLVGIYLRNVDEWNTSLHPSQQNSDTVRLSARDNGGRLTSHPHASPVCYSFSVKIASALTSSCARGALSPQAFYFENNRSRTSLMARLGTLGVGWYGGRFPCSTTARRLRPRMARMRRLESAIYVRRIADIC